METKFATLFLNDRNSQTLSLQKCFQKDLKMLQKYLLSPRCFQNVPKLVQKRQLISKRLQVCGSIFNMLFSIRNSINFLRQCISQYLKRSTLILTTKKTKHFLFLKCLKECNFYFKMLLKCFEIDSKCNAMLGMIKSTFELKKQNMLYHPRG